MSYCKPLSLLNHSDTLKCQYQKLIKKSHETYMKSNLIQQSLINSLKNTQLLTKSYKFNKNIHNQTEIGFQKLLQEQDLLILHLKQKINQLVKFRSQCQQLQIMIVDLQRKYIQKGKDKGKRQVINIKQTNKNQHQYRQLHIELQSLSKQSGQKYSNILKLQNQHAKLRQQLVLFEEQFIQLKTQHMIISRKNQQNQLTKQTLKKEYERQKMMNMQLQVKSDQENMILNQNKVKLQKLLIQVKKIQQQGAQLKRLSQVATQDNQRLKLTSKLRIQQLKSKQVILNKLLIEKQLIKKQKQRALIQIKQYQKQSQRNEVLLNQEKNKSFELNEELQHLIGSGSMKQAEMSTISEGALIKLWSLRDINLDLYKSNKQDLRRNIYFIQQYNLVNNQLKLQMELFMRQQIQKNALSSNKYTKHQQRKQVIVDLKDYLTAITDELYNNEQTILQLKQKFSLLV